MNNSNSLFLTPITEEEILNVVLNMSYETSTDCYNINMETVKKCIEVIVKPLTNIFKNLLIQVCSLIARILQRW